MHFLAMARRNFLVGRSESLPISVQTEISRDTAVSSFENYAENLQDNFGEEMPTNPEFLLTVQLFVGRMFIEIFSESSGDHHDLKIRHRSESENPRTKRPGEIFKIWAQLKKTDLND